MDLDATPTFGAKQAAGLTDVEQARKMRGTERQKSMHLVRQLQLRLQYAKLKVDHGWEQQRLNEVENLYFRQQRSPGANTSPNKGNGNGQYRALTPAPIPAPLDPQLAPYASTYAAEPPAGSHYQYQYQYRPPLAMDARGMEFLHDLPPENGSSGAPWAAPDTSVAGPSTTSYTQFFAPPPPPPESAGPWLQPDPAGPAPSKLTSYDSFWSSHRDAPAPDAQLAAAAYPRSAKGKGRAGVSSGRIVKRASPPDLPGHAQPPVQVQLAGPG